MKVKAGDSYRLYNEDCLKLMKHMANRGQLVDSIISDPPYHLTSIVQRFGGKNAKCAKHGTDGAFARLSKGFLNQEWDGGEIAFDPETWKLAYKVIKPGGYLVLFAATRNFHRMASAVEQAGFIIKDQMVSMKNASPDLRNWLDSQSPEQLNALLNIIDQQSPLGMYLWAYSSGFPKGTSIGKSIDKRLKNKRVDGPVAPDAIKYEGYKTQLKPSYEPILVAQKPVAKGSVIDNVLQYGTGAMNIDGNRVPYASEADKKVLVDKRTLKPMGGFEYWGKSIMHGVGKDIAYQEPVGRYPSNVVHDGSNSVNKLFATFNPSKGNSVNNSIGRYLYCAKSSKRDKNYGMPEGQVNTHPTPKPLSLMALLVSLFMPPEGTVFDPFMGSGSTGIAATRLGFKFIGCDFTSAYFDIAKARIAYTVDDLAAADSPIFEGEPLHFSLKYISHRKTREDQKNIKAKNSK